MARISFDSQAATYEEQALVQRSAAEVLFELLSIQPHENILDLGCGPGHLTAAIAGRTSGRVLGLDVSPGMIAQAALKYGHLSNVRFAMADATVFQVDRPFDAIFCNSTLQWLREPALACCLAALKPGGRIAVQAPAGADWCPNFLAAVEKVRSHPYTRDTFRAFQSPWLFLDSPGEYAQLYQNAGFKVLHCCFRPEANPYTPEQTYRIFQSGAENGFLNQAYYPVELTSRYVETFRQVVRKAFADQAGAAGLVELKFTRIFLLARKGTVLNVTLGMMVRDNPVPRPKQDSNCLQIGARSRLSRLTSLQ